MNLINGTYYYMKGENIVSLYLRNTRYYSQYGPFLKKERIKLVLEVYGFMQKAHIWDILGKKSRKLRLFSIVPGQIAECIIQHLGGS